LERPNSGLSSSLAGDASVPEITLIFQHYAVMEFCRATVLPPEYAGSDALIRLLPPPLRGVNKV
jgi:hypothetical protein